MAAVHNFSLDQGSDKVVYFVLRDKSGPIDLSGYSAAMQVRRYAFSEAAIDTLTTCNGRLLIDGPAGKITAKFNHRNSRRKPPNSFGWRNAANLSLPIYLLSPMKGVCLSTPCAKVLP